MEILELHKINPFLLLFTVTVFMLMCMVGRILLFVFLPLQFCGISSSAKKSSHFVLFSKFFYFISVLNYGVYLHGCAAVLILLLSVYSLSRKVTEYSFFSLAI